MKQKILLLIAIFTCFAQSLVAQGNLLIFPKRIVFDGVRDRVQTINLINTGKDTATYKLSYKQIRMDEEGHFQPIQIPDPNQYFASPNLRFYPRRVTLPPNEAQTIKIQLIKTNELKEGEYRSHLYFRAVPKITLLEKKVLETSANLKIKLTPIFGITIANIITIGENTTKVQLTNLKLKFSKNKTAILSLNFNRQGNRSAYGSIEVHHISTEGIKQKVATIKGFAVYSPTNTRKSKIALNTKLKIDYAKGRLEVRFIAEDTSKLYAEATHNLN